MEALSTPARSRSIARGAAKTNPFSLRGNSHLSATYSGDISYNAVATGVVDTVMVSKAATATALAASPSTVTTGTSVTLTATISSGATVRSAQRER